MELHEVVYLQDEQGLNPVLVFDYFEHDIFGLMMKKVRFHLKHVKLIFQQIIVGLMDMHEKNIFHCDMKPANILLNNKGEVRIADLGLSLQFNSKDSKIYKPCTTTILYSSPEQLFRLSDGYGLSSDIWGLGCILTELLIGQPLFMAKNYQHLIELFMARFGREISNCDKIKKSTFFNKFKHKLDVKSDIINILKKKNSKLDANSLDLLSLLLKIDPEKRIKLKNILTHPFFCDEPLPASIDEMPQIEKHCHEYTVRLEHKKNKKKILFEKKRKNSLKGQNCLDSQNASTGISFAKNSKHFENRNSYLPKNNKKYKIN